MLLPQYRLEVYSNILLGFEEFLHRILYSAHGNILSHCRGTECSVTEVLAVPEKSLQALKSEFAKTCANAYSKS